MFTKIVQQPELNFKSHYCLKVVKRKKLECSCHNKLLTVVEHDIVACVQNAFLCFETCIKAKSTLVNRLMNATLLDA